MAQRGIRKRRIAAGGALLVGLGILIGWLGGHFPGMGGGDTNAIGVNTDPHIKPISQTKEKPPSKTETPRTAKPEKLLVIRVDERSYFVRKVSEEAGTFEQIALSQLLERAKKTTGGPSGIRVQIERKRTARENAVDKLYAELLKAGLDRNSIHKKAGTID